VPGGEPAGGGLDRVLQGAQLGPADQVGQHADRGQERRVAAIAAVVAVVSVVEGGQHVMAADLADCAVQP